MSFHDPSVIWVSASPFNWKSFPTGSSRIVILLYIGKLVVRPQGPRSANFGNHPKADRLSWDIKATGQD